MNITGNNDTVSAILLQ